MNVEEARVELQSHVKGVCGLIWVTEIMAAADAYALAVLDEAIPDRPPSKSGARYRWERIRARIKGEGSP